MKAVVQNNKSGELKLEDIPVPQVKPNGVLVENRYSLISIGTEKLMMDFAQKSLLGKARSRPDLTRQVMNLAKREGLLTAYKESINRLDQLTQLGYSAAGEVIAVGNQVKDVKVGDRVCCAKGGFASHAEVIAVPTQLCVKIPKNVEFSHAAFGTVGAIALHAIRQCKLQFGELVAIIGLGLLGQLAVQIAKSAGYKVFGIDIDKQKTMLAKTLGADETVLVTDDVVKQAEVFTKAEGFDAAVILASTKSNEPLITAAEICRQNARVIVPGMIQLEVPRDLFYHKELQLVVSRAWGPGFDDPQYEVKGIDYPHSYVRWTAGKNIEHFLELIQKGKIQVDPLITHTFPIKDAEQAYNEIKTNTSREYIGVLLEYDVSSNHHHDTTLKLLKKKSYTAKDHINVGLIGAGAFASVRILPCLQKIQNINLKAVCTSNGANAKHVGEKYNFEYCTTDYSRLLKDEDIDCVIISTRHHLHAKFVIESLKHGKDVFVEKPLALNEKELSEIISTYKKYNNRLMVGFNRRYSPCAVKAKQFLKQINEPLVINYRVNAGFIPPDSWVHDPLEGGGRVLGEICHFVDLALFFIDALPIKVFAEGLDNISIYHLNENVQITIKFDDGSVAAITYIANGDKAFPRERVEIFGGGCVCVIDDFKRLTFTHKGKTTKIRGLGRDMGYHTEFDTFFSTIQKEKDLTMNFKEYIYTTIATFCIEKSLSNNVPVEIESVLCSL